LLVSILRNIGSATIGELGELELLLEEQAIKLRNVKRIINCKVDINSDVFNLETEDFSSEKIAKILPGLRTGSTINYSPFISINIPFGKKAEISSLEEDSLINFDKITGYDKFGGQLSDKLPVSFNLWLEKNRRKILVELLKYLKENFSVVQEEKEVLNRETPRYLVFSFKDNGTYKFPGEIDSFKELYLILKKVRPSGLQKREDQLLCLGCGSVKADLIPLKDLKFFDFFSLDQPMFWLGFQKDSYQAMVCEECEKLIRKGYQVFDSILKFEAYKLKISEKEWETTYHSILPLSDNSKRLNQFIQGLTEYRENFYKSEQKSVIQKLEKLVEELEYYSKGANKQLEKRIKKLEKRREFLEKKGMVIASREIPVVNLLKEAAKRKAGLMDFFYKEESYPGGKKKVVKDIIYGDKQRISQIVKWLEETQEEFKGRVFFGLKILVNIFDEKMGRLIFQSLFTEKKIHERDLFRAAYSKLWKLFRKSLIAKEKLSNEEKFYIIQGSNTLHFTLSLLQKAKILR